MILKLTWLVIIKIEVLNFAFNLTITKNHITIDWYNY